MPGKRRAAILLVANGRTRGLRWPFRAEAASPSWSRTASTSRCGRRTPRSTRPSDVVTFVFMGRLIGWKSVDLLLRAFAEARNGAPMRLWILGDGDQRAT